MGDLVAGYRGDEAGTSVMLVFESRKRIGVMS